MKNIVFGFHSAEEAVKSYPEKISQIYTIGGQRTPRLKRLLDYAHSKRVPIKIVDKHALKRLTSSDHHQDIVLEISPYSYQDAEELLSNLKDDSLFCILDEIQDAGNLGSLIRTMEGAGVDAVFMPERRSAMITATTHRASAGALEHVKIARVVNLARLMDRMHELGIRIICADSAATKLWHEADYSGPIAILVGNENKGVRRLLKEKSDDLVRIPMFGKLDSLNVNVAAAILLYEVIRHRVTTETQRH